MLPEYGGVHATVCDVVDIELDISAEAFACAVPLDGAGTAVVWVMTVTMLVGVGCTGVGGVINSIISFWLVAEIGHVSIQVSVMDLHAIMCPPHYLSWVSLG